MRILVTVGLFLSISPVFADLTDVAKQLNTIAIENEAAARPLEDERIKAADEKTLLEARIKELEAQKAKTIKPVETKVDSSTLDSILLKGPLGRCKIKQGDHEREYIITNGDKTIRMIFAPFDSPLTPVAQHVKADDGLSVIEISQNKFTPERLENPGEMSGVIRFEPDSLRVIHATFRGQKLFDKWGGYSSSYASYQLSCVL